MQRDYESRRKKESRRDLYQRGSKRIIQKAEERRNYGRTFIRKKAKQKEERIKEGLLLERKQRDNTESKRKKELRDEYIREKAKGLKEGMYQRGSRGIIQRAEGEGIKEGQLLERKQRDYTESRRQKELRKEYIIERK